MNISDSFNLLEYVVLVKIFAEIPTSNRYGVGKEVFQELLLVIVNIFIVLHKNNKWERLCEIHTIKPYTVFIFCYIKFQSKFSTLPFCRGWSFGAISSKNQGLFLALCPVLVLLGRPYTVPWIKLGLALCKKIALSPLKYPWAISLILPVQTILSIHFDRVTLVSSFTMISYGNILLLT